MSKKSKARTAAVRSILDELGGGDDPIPQENMSKAHAEMFAQMVRDDAEGPTPDDDAPEVCHEHGKRQYRSMAEVKKVIRSRQRNGAGRLRAYLCEHCHRYHISSSFHRRHIS